ncbi:MAG TPA: hypothetical protein VK540_08105 [Polyangiaceae bacterium]|nr:hypothetical protein [Polyangiaceae bacterium]
MKHIATTALALCVALILSCSDAANETVDVGQSQTPLVSNFTVTNGSVQLPPDATHLCHATKFTCSGAHLNLPPIGFGVYTDGGWLHVGASSTTVPGYAVALPNYTSGQNAKGNCRVDVQCDQWANFHGTAGGVSPETEMHWFYSGGSPAFENGAVTMAWGLDVACFISHTYGMSNVGERVEIIPGAVGGWNWQLQVAGFRSIAGSSRCAWLGRPVQAWQFLQATPSGPGISTISPSNGVCFITDMEGVVDDGTVRIVGNPMRLEAVGQVTKAKAACTTY